MAPVLCAWSCLLMVTGNAAQYAMPAGIKRPLRVLPHFHLLEALVIVW